MFQRCDNLKRVISLLGVALALSSTLQQTRAFCYLAGCAPTSKIDTSEEHCCSNHDCPHSRERDATAEQDRSRDDLCRSYPGQCPCPQDCWCHQSPEPFEVPRIVLVPSELLVLGPVYMDVAFMGAPHGDQFSQDATIAILDSSVKSATQVCAHLCRFLT